MGGDGFELVSDLQATLGESPVWEADRQTLRLTDITGRRLHRLDPATGVVETEAMAEEVGCFALSRAGGIIAATRSGIRAMCNDRTPERLLAANPEAAEGRRFNDGTTDPRGRFFAGTVDKAKTGRASLYRYDRRGLTRVQDGLMTANGLAFSPDGRVMYHADTPRFTVYAYDYDPDTGTPSNRRPFVRLSPGAPNNGRPDGAAVDAEGCYWTALWEGARVHRYAPSGELLAAYPVPARSPTMPCFGGPDLRTLYLTSAREGCSADDLSRFPASGGVFAMRVDVPGLPKPPFDPEI